MTPATTRAVGSHSQSRAQQPAERPRRGDGEDRPALEVELEDGVHAVELLAVRVLDERHLAGEERGAAGGDEQEAGALGALAVAVGDGQGAEQQDRQQRQHGVAGEGGDGDGQSDHRVEQVLALAAAARQQAARRAPRPAPRAGRAAGRRR